MGANFGPYKYKEFEEKYRSLFKKYDDICFREKYSFNIFKDLENVRVAPDIIFSLKTESHTSKLQRCIGFSIINIENRKELKEYNVSYEKKIIELIEYYINLDFKIKLFSFCENEGDMIAIYNIIENRDSKLKDRIEVINYEGNLNTFIDEFKCCPTIVGTRFHSIILALLFGQDILPIIYSDKTYNVLKDLNINKEYCYIKDILKLDVEAISERIKVNKLLNKDIISRSELQFYNLDLYLKQE